MENEIFLKRGFFYRLVRRGASRLGESRGSARRIADSRAKRSRTSGFYWPVPVGGKCPRPGGQQIRAIIAK